MAEGSFLLLVLRPGLGCARSRLGSVQQRRVQPAGRSHIRLLGAEPPDAGQQQRRVQSAVVFRGWLCHRLVRRSGRITQFVVTGTSRLSGGTAAPGDVHPPAAHLCRRLRLGGGSTAPAADLGRPAAAGSEGGEKAGAARFGTVDGGRIVGGAEFPVVAQLCPVFP
jgi:hypothetical protein